MLARRSPSRCSRASSNGSARSNSASTPGWAPEVALRRAPWRRPALLTRPFLPISCGDNRSRGGFSMRLRTIAVAVATTGMMVGPAFAHGVLGSAAGAKAECTISGTAADDVLNGNTRDDVLCGTAGQDTINAGEGNDIIRGAQGDDNQNAYGVGGEDGSDIVRG